MRIASWLLATACVVALPAMAVAQQTTTQPYTQQTYTPSDNEPYPIASHWLVSGALGTDFENAAEDPGTNFAATAGWLYRGVLGGEFQSNFSPDFQLNSALMPPFMANEPAINSYMLNVIGALPLMAGGQFQPYASGGYGWYTLRGDLTEGDSNINLNQNDTGWNVGGGLMGFLGQMGIRADLRYFKVSGDEFQGVDSAVLRSRWGAVVDDQEGLVNANVISGMSFWRGDVGVALRW